MQITKAAVTTVVSTVSKRRNICLSKVEESRAIEVLQKRAKADWGQSEWDAAITSLVESWRTNPMEQESAKRALAANEICPICQRAGEPITLLRGRKAFYCRAHAVVMPAVVN